MYSVSVDSQTVFSAQTDDVQSIFACPECYFRNTADIMSGQTIEVKLRSGASAPTADRVILKQGTIDGQIASIEGSSYMLIPFNPIFAGQALTVVTAGATVFENFPANSSPAVGNKVAVRGLLLRSAPAGPTVVAKQVSLIP